jgi:hypothetical protein
MGNELRAIFSPDGALARSAKPVAPVQVNDPVDAEEDALNKFAAPGIIEGLNDNVRTGPQRGMVQRRDRRGRPIGNPVPDRMGQTTQSPADFNKTGGIGAKIRLAQVGKTPEEQAAIARGAFEREQTIRNQGVNSEEYWRNRNADGSMKSLSDRVKATGVDGMEPTAKRDFTAESQARTAATVASPKYQELLLKRDLELKSAEESKLRFKTPGGGMTVAVNPDYAGPGQVTTALALGANGRLMNVVKPGALTVPNAPIQYAGPDGPKTIPTEFKQGYGNFPKIEGVTSIASTNPTGRPLASLADGSFLGGGSNIPSLYDNPAVAQADKTVNGPNRSDLMNAFKEADAKQKSGLSAPAVAAEKKPASEEEDRKKFAAPIKLSLS